MTIVAKASEIPDIKLLTLLILDTDRHKDKTIKPATKVSFKPKSEVTITQNGEKANIIKILILEIWFISLLKFNGYIEAKYIEIKNIQKNKNFGKELFKAASGAKKL